jgi:CRP/FNR family transcriptional regulator, cyclic AMP receptor protein
MRRIGALIAESPVFAGLTADQLELIAGCGHNVVFAAGKRLFREGDPADTFFLIRHGLVGLDTYVPARGEVRTETLGPGEIVGWSWLLAPYQWHFSGQAAEPVRATEFDGACLREKCEADPRLGYELLQRFSQLLIDRLQATRLQLLDLYNDPTAT